MTTTTCENFSPNWSHHFCFSYIDECESLFKSDTAVVIEFYSTQKSKCGKKFF